MSRLVAILLLVFGSAGAALAQSGSNLTSVIGGPPEALMGHATIDVRVTIVAPITVAAHRNLDFGHVAIGTSDVGVNAAASPAYGQSGHLAITGNPSSTVNITTFEGPALGPGVTWTPAISATGSQVLSNSGTLALYVGGTLNVASNADAGDYGTTFSIDVAYTSI